jgi:hypothetical protein
MEECDVADENELNELRERLGRLSGGEQVWLLEAVLADNRRRWAEEVARHQAAVAELLEWETQQRESIASSAAQQESKREAG